MIQFMRLHWQQDVHYLPGLWLQQTIYEVSRNVNSALTLKVLVTTIDAQWEGMGCRVGEVRAGTTSPMPDHKGFKPQ